MGFFELEPRRPLLVPTPRGVRLDGSATKRGPRGPRGPQGVGADGAVQVALSQQAGTAMRVAVAAGTVGLLVIGDSKTFGIGLTAYADRWQNRLLGLMRARFPIAGGDTMRGLVPANMSDPYDAMSGRPTTTGTTYPVDTAGLGYNTLQLELGSVLTFPAATWPAASTLPIGYHTHFGASGTLEVLVDGVVQTEINCAGTGEGEPMRTSIPVAAGTHTVSMRPKTGTAPVRVMYVEQRSASGGWHLYDATRPGLAARHVVAGPPGAPQGGSSFAGAVADLPSVQLAVIALGANDMTISAPAQYGADVRGVVDMVKAGHPTAGVVVVLPAALTDDSAVVDDVQAYHTAARAALVDVPDLSVVAETQLVDLTGPNAGAWLADSVHPNAFGHDIISRALAGSLIGLDAATDTVSLAEAAAAPAVTAAQAAQTAAEEARDRVGVFKVQPGNTSFVNASRNLYNPDDPDVAPGYALSGTSAGRGSLVASANYTVTGFIPVVPGQQYTLSNPRSWAFYDAAKSAPIPAEFYGSDSGMGVQTLTVPEGAAYLRATYYTSLYGDTFQVEKGATATAYEPYYVTVPGLTVPDLPPVTPDGTTFVNASPNLYNAQAPDVMPGYTLSGPTPAALSTYTLTGFIPIVPGQTYTLSNPRNWAMYDENKTYVTGTSGSDSTSATVTLTAPAGAAYLRASYMTATYGTTFQVERGSTATPYQPFGLTIPGLLLPSEGAAPISVTATGTGPVTITRTVGGKALVDAVNIAETIRNKGFQFGVTTYDGVAMSTSSDDITPIRTQNGTVAANHGYATVCSFANPDGKDNSDIGSTWTDGATTYTLLAFDAGRPVLGGPYTRSSGGIVTTTTVNPTASLTHVAGATHTANIDHTTKTTTQLYPTMVRRRVRLYVDGVERTGAGSWAGSLVSIREAAEVLDYADLVDKAQATPGKTIDELDPAGAVMVETEYRYTPGGACRVTTDLTELAPTILGACGIVQAGQLSPAGSYTRIRNIPGVLPISGHDLAAGIDPATWSTSLIVSSSDLKFPGHPPLVDVERVQASGATVVAFAIGIHPHASADSDTTTRATVAASNYWDVRSTSKHYPTAWVGVPAGWGHLRGVAFRAWLAPAAADAVATATHPATAFAALAAETGL